MRKGKGDTGMLPARAALHESLDARKQKQMHRNIRCVETRAFACLAFDFGIAIATLPKVISLQQGPFVLKNEQQC